MGAATGHDGPGRQRGPSLERLPVVILGGGAVASGLAASWLFSDACTLSWGCLILGPLMIALAALGALLALGWLLLPGAGDPAVAPASPEPPLSDAQRSGLAWLQEQVGHFEHADLELLGACRIGTQRTGADRLGIARAAARPVVAERTLREAQRSVEMIAMRCLDGRQWPAESRLYARHDHLIGPALETLDDMVLALLARERADAGTVTILASDWCEQAAVSGRPLLPGPPVPRCTDRPAAPPPLPP